MKHYSLFLVFSLFSSCSFAGNSLAEICREDGSELIKNAKIQNYTAATIWPQQEENKDQMSVQIKVNDRWFGIFSQHLTSGGGNYGIQSYTQTLALLSQPVDVCVKGGVLRGIENAGSWPK